MQTYLGVKLIKAEPLNLGDYNIKRGWTIPANEDPATEGYFLEYEDGYVSWSPKKIFEEAYRRIDGLTFGLALEALKKGLVVTRSKWNKQVTVFMGTEKDYLYMKSGEDIISTGWMPMRIDMMAEDWQIVNK